MQKAVTVLKPCKISEIEKPLLPKRRARRKYPLRGECSEACMLCSEPATKLALFDVGGVFTSKKYCEAHVKDAKYVPSEVGVKVLKPFRISDITKEHKIDVIRHTASRYIEKGLSGTCVVCSDPATQIAYFKVDGCIVVQRFCNSHISDAKYVVS